MSLTFGAMKNYHDPRREMPASYGLNQCTQLAYQEPYFIRDQGVFPACEGCAHASCFDTVDYKASGFDLWRDARRRQGMLGWSMSGTYDKFARESAQKLGVVRARDGEFDNTPERWRDAIRMPRLDVQIEATENRKILGDVHSINPWGSRAFWDLMSAIEAGYRVVVTYPVKPKFRRIGPGQVVGLDEIGSGGEVIGYHANRLIGVSTMPVTFRGLGRPEHAIGFGMPQVVILQNSHGTSHGDGGLLQVDATSLGQMFDTINLFRVDQ